MYVSLRGHTLPPVKSFFNKELTEKIFKEGVIALSHGSLEIIH